jgi:hypothetical protein
MAGKKATVNAKQRARSRKSPSTKAKPASEKIFGALKKKARQSDKAHPRLKRDGDDA